MFEILSALFLVTASPTEFNKTTIDSESVVKFGVTTEGYSDYLGYMLSCSDTKFVILVEKNHIGSVNKKLQLVIDGRKVDLPYTLVKNSDYYYRSTLKTDDMILDMLKNSDKLEINTPVGSFSGTFQNYKEEIKKFVDLCRKRK